MRIQFRVAIMSGALFAIAIATLAATTFYVPANNAEGTLNATIDADDTTLVLTTGGGALFPSTYPYPISIDDEILKVTNRSSDTFTVERAQEDTVAAEHIAGATVELRITAKFISDLNTAVNAIEGMAIVSETDIDTEAEFEALLTDTTDILTNNDANYAFLIDSAGTSGYVWTSDGTGKGVWSASAADDMGDVDTESELEAALTDVLDILTNNDANYDYMINSAGTLGQVWTSDGSGRGTWETPTMGGVDTEAELEAAIIDAANILTSNDTYWGYLINSVGTYGQVWTSTGIGRGQWSTPAEADNMGDVDTEAELEAAIVDVTDILTDTDSAYTYLITSAGTSGYVWTSDGDGKGVWASTGDMNSFTLAGGSGDDQTIEDGDTLSVLGGDGIATVTANNDTITVSVDIVNTTAETTADDADLILIYDDTASANRVMTRADFLAGISGGGDDMGAVDTEAELETALTDVTDVFTSNDANYAYLIDSAGTSGQVWTSDGSGKGGWAAATGGGASAFTDLSDAPSSYTGAAGKFVRVNVGADGLEFATVSGGSGGGPDTLCRWRVSDATPHPNLPAQLDTRNSNTVLDFDADTDETMYFDDILPRRYGGGGVVVEIHYAMTTATSGNVVWAVGWENQADEAQDLDSDGFASAKTVTHAVSDTSGKVKRATIAFSDGAEMDSVGAGDLFRVSLVRDADNASDTATGDAEVRFVHVYEYEAE